MCSWIVTSTEDCLAQRYSHQIRLFQRQCIIKRPWFSNPLSSIISVSQIQTLGSPCLEPPQVLLVEYQAWELLSENWRIRGHIRFGLNLHHDFTTSRRAPTSVLLAPVLMSIIRPMKTIRQHAPALSILPETSVSRGSNLEPPMLEQIRTWLYVVGRLHNQAYYESEIDVGEWIKCPTWRWAKTCTVCRDSSRRRERVRERDEGIHCARELNWDKSGKREGPIFDHSWP